MPKLSKLQKRRIARLSAVALSVAALIIAGQLIGAGQFDVLDAQGTISAQQRNLLSFATILCILIVTPVFALTFIIVRTYRVDAKKPAVYTPDWDGNNRLEALWWGIPAIVILALSVVTWQSTHALDPFKAISSKQPPLDIQVIALQWKWLFIYPEQGIASVNYVQFPEDRPVRFTVTSDAPMNSFFIPQLGGQIYAMSGMKTQLNLQADHTGNFRGMSANLSGDGFADMDFTAQATSAKTFSIWADMASRQSPELNQTVYERLALPGVPQQPTQYKLTDGMLFDKVVNKYMSYDQKETETK